MSHADRVLEYLKKGNSITQKEASELWGCERLGARICELRSRIDLKEQGYEIVTAMVESVNRYGERVRFGRYWLRRKGTAA